MPPQLTKIAACAALLALLCADAWAQKRTGKGVPRFEDYPVKDIDQGKSAPLVLESAEQRESVTYYQAIADGGTNFAGHYAVVILTCGAACISLEFLDTRTGKIIPTDIYISGWKQHHDAFRPIEFRRGSRLIVFAGGIDQKRPFGWHFYEFNQGRLKRLHTVVTGGDFRKPLTEWMK